ncbi:uncharacterized protein [Prorops nasuta]|uniref:uncharacterized protein n=1 Tax=Prorops nasuta TaxID=863751 RepID=UPI0034CE32FD
MMKKVPPNGGWGWVVVLANALNSLSTIPILQNFSLVFKDKFSRLGLTATDVTIIININMAFGMILGLINGPLLRKYGYRKIAVFGSFIYTSGVTLTAFANTFALIIVTYGIMASLGMGLMMSSFSLALNSFFTTRRNRATGLAMTITGLGPIFMPQVTSFLMTFYGLQGTILVFGAISFHSLIAASLLQPLKWHLVFCPISQAEIQELNGNKCDDDTVCCEDNGSYKTSMAEISAAIERKRRVTISSIDHDIEVSSIYGFDTPLPTQLSETANSASEKQLDELKDVTPDYHWWNSCKSVNTINLGSSVKIFDEPSDPFIRNDLTIDAPKILPNWQNIKGHVNSDMTVRNLRDVHTTKTDINVNHSEILINGKMPKSVTSRIFRGIVQFYDLSLLRDPIYVNIMLGMSIAIFAELNFSLLTPFILGDMGLSNSKIATVMSLVASFDLIFRGVAPYVGEWLKWSARTMYLFSLILLIISRTTLIFTFGYGSILCVAIGLGIAKGIRSVYMVLVIPNYVPLERLPYASGIQMLVNGIILMAAGPFLGFIRDISGSYIPCIFVINCVTAVTVIIWTVEMIVLRRKARKINIEHKKIDSIE